MQAHCDNSIQVVNFSTDYSSTTYCGHCVTSYEVIKRDVKFSIFSHSPDLLSPLLDGRYHACVNWIITSHPQCRFVAFGLLGGFQSCPRGTRLVSMKL